MNDPIRPASPCVGICQLQVTTAGQICIGCGRSLQEIAGWSAATPLRQQQICREAARRREAMQAVQQ